jgi:DNA polymerase-3 subunit delta'
MPVPTVALGAAWLAEQGVEDPLFVLAEAGNAPLRAMENARGRHFERRKSFLERLANGTLDPIRDAATHDSTELPEVLGWLHKWTYDLVANRLTGRARYNPDYADSLQRISRQANVVQLGRYYRTLVSYRSRLGHPLSSRLVLEHLFFLYLRCLDRRK